MTRYRVTRVSAECRDVSADAEVRARAANRSTNVATAMNTSPRPARCCESANCCREPGDRDHERLRRHPRM